MNNKFFTELSRILAKDGIPTAPPENGRLPILLNGQPIGRVESSGTMCIAPGDIQTPESSDLYFRTAGIADTVKEYMTAMETAPILHADGLDEEFKLLTEFNGTVLAGREMEQGYGMKFVTWNWSYGKTGLYQGHYYLDNYAAAKENFAERAGLVSHDRLFSKEQLVEMYRCMADTVDSGYELTLEQEKIIEGTQRQIERAVPDLQERIVQAVQQSLQMSEGQTFGG